MLRVLPFVLVAASANVRAAGDDYALVGSFDVVESRHAARPRWSADGVWLYYDDLDASGYFSIFRVRADGSERGCVSCDLAGLPGHAGAVSAYPSGRYLAFSAQAGTHAPGAVSITGPGAGIDNDIAVLDVATGTMTRLTDVRAPAASRGSLYPRCSPDGRAIAWGEFVKAGAKHARFGQWRLAVGEFVEGPTPRLERVRRFMSSEPYGVEFGRPFLAWLRTELWIADADGANRRQLTFYNQPGHAHYAGTRVMVSEMDWHPDGEHIAVRVHHVGREFDRNDDRSVIRVFRFSRTPALR